MSRPARPFNIIEHTNEETIKNVLAATHYATHTPPKVKESEYHLNLAQTFAGIFAHHLTKQGRGREASDFVEEINRHIQRVRALHTKIQKVECVEDHAKAECGTCGYLSKEKRKRSIKELVAKALGAAAEIKKSDLLKIGDLPRAGKVPPMQRYDYRPIHLLHPHDQPLAQQRFKGGDPGDYNYPVDKDSGRLVHAPRVKSTTPRPLKSSYQELKAEHTPGQAVRITGHDQLHGKLGIVKAPHPEMAGKIAVQIGPSAHHTVYVEPHQVQSSRPQTKVEKALVTLHSIRKAQERVTKSEDTPNLPARRSKTAPATQERTVAKDRLSFSVHNSDRTGKVGKKIGDLHIDKEGFTQNPFVHEHLKTFLEQQSHIPPQPKPGKHPTTRQALSAGAGSWGDHQGKAKKHLEVGGKHFVAVSDKPLQHVQEKSLGWLTGIMGQMQERHESGRDATALTHETAIPAQYRRVSED